MELDTLKNSWNTISVDVNRDQFDIISATKKEMKSPLAGLKKKVQKQIKILPLLFAFLVVIAVKMPEAQHNILIWMGLVILPLTTIYYYFNLKLITDLEEVNGSVKDDIQNKIKKLISTNRIYLIVNRVIFALLIIGIEGLIRNSRLDLVPGLETLKNIVFPLRVLIYAGIFGLHYVVSKYTFTYYFGKYIRQLKNILTEMQ
ncbi:hypothetical protein N6B72_01400 [Chryseobacterium soli]|uniref:hypothetical protein n=1 Tax=Chryseobacterium soli TaxID=445961 RepID=UPI0029558501|nr:hypothetical protein [Chryseobacterium soli]MDV7695563.1 hypothetical protein [Chryseobacterium soli]